MRFFANHGLLILFSVATGLFVAGVMQNMAPLMRPDRSKFQGSFAKILLISLIIFIGWGYLRTPAYYSKRLWGMLGDNYLYMRQALDRPTYFNPQHFVYPWLPGQLVQLGESMHWLTKIDPYYLEKAYALSTWPARVSLSFGLLFFLWVLRRIDWSYQDAALGTLLLGTSQGCWLWGIQGNAMGVAIASEIISGGLFLLWLARPSFWRTSLLGFSLALGLFAHISTLYFACGGYLAVLFWTLCSPEFKKAKARSLLLFHAPILLMACLFYGFAAHDVRSWDPHQIFWRLADKSVGSFAPGMRALVIAVKDNLVNAIVNLCGFWDPQNRADKWLIAAQIALVTSLLISRLQSWRTWQTFYFWKQASFFLAASGVVFVGFTLRSAGTQYFAIATAPNVMLLVLFLLGGEAFNQKAIRLLLFGFIACRFAYSGFSSESVFAMTRLHDYDYLQPAPDKHLSPADRYTPQAIANYYRLKLRPNKS